jgi:RimJ/RimL family protein N-acetyltransferase
MLQQQPELKTERLRLRPLAIADAPDIRKLAGAQEIADTTLLIPHPYPDGAAEIFINGVARDWAEKKSAVFAITLAESGQLCGTIGLVLEPKHCRAEMGYWVGVPFWGKGICTEAARRLLAFGFGELNLNKIHAHHFTRNPASGRVLQKLGMKYEGQLRQHVLKTDHFEDLYSYGILRSEFSPS